MQFGKPLNTLPLGSSSMWVSFFSVNLFYASAYVFCSRFLSRLYLFYYIQFCAVLSELIFKDSIHISSHSLHLHPTFSFSRGDGQKDRGGRVQEFHFAGWDNHIWKDWTFKYHGEYFKTRKLKTESPIFTLGNLKFIIVFKKSI